MKKQTLTEEIYKMKSMMNKLLNEDFFSYNKMDETHSEHELPMDDSDENQMDSKFKVGDIVVDPKDLHPTKLPGKILHVFPNLKSAEGHGDYERTVKQLTPDEDENDAWYLIDWESEGVGLYPKKHVDDQVELAPEDVEFANDEEDNYNDYDDYDGPDDYEDPRVADKEWGGNDY